MKELIPQTAVETIRPNGWLLSFDGDRSNPQFGLPSGWTSLPSCRSATELGALIALVRLSTNINYTLGVLATQPVCFCECRIKFLDTNYNLELLARQPHCLIYWGDNVQCFGFVFEPYGVIHPPTQLLLYKEEAQQRNCNGCDVSEFLLGDIEYSPSKESKQISIPPSKDSPSTTSSLSHIPPSNSSPSKKRRNWGEGNGSIHWRTITRGGKDYPQAYYHWKENGRKRTKYIPKHLLGVIQEAEEHKRPVIEILGLLGVVPNDSNEELLVGIENSPSNDGEQLSPPTSKDSPSNDGEQLSPPTSKDSPSNDGEQLSPPTSKDSPSKMRRDKGLGTGDLQWKTITLNGKDYPQAWYHYEFWKDGDRLVKKSKYIPKRLVRRIEKLEAEKAPVREILSLLGVKW